ncbi:methyltransferase [Psychroflexus torquis ATCC 700755]|uniref:Methyltransferase n=1 Tax=Psychroflexus torquis (strain ATCC 700755 / CIP 106069 / ACAM 623) TaxID=313595 RepID=K4IHJ0_PSYTT|nr:methyltransferase [Psychroflexus torquis]AFU69283.1 methyltransferase [Psychroflexus torquis ATCC 700755]
MYEKHYPEKRFNITMEFLKSHAHSPSTILDLGVENPFSKLMTAEGFSVENTKGQDLDVDRNQLFSSSAKITTAFEIFEHLLSPLEILKSVQSEHLFASVPLKLWFSKAYQSKTDPWDRHYHEFETWQFNWLLKKAGWEIIEAKTFTHPVRKIGFRPLLRLITPRYYLVYCQRKS